jgi:hypothetical protein
VHEETCGNCRCCRSSIAHRLESGVACICSATKGARYCQNEVAFLRSPRGGPPRRKVNLPQQFDEYVWFDETRAVTPLDTAEIKGLPDTYPFGV